MALDRNGRDSAKFQRGRIDVIGDMLRICASAAIRKTHLMQRANLSYDQVNIYLDTLLSSRLLETMTIEDGRKGEAYKASENGIKVLHHYNNIKTALGEEEKLPV